MTEVATQNDVLNIAAYKFVPLTELGPRRGALRRLCLELKLRGTILLSHEGINLFVAGSRASVEQLLDRLRADSQIGELEVKESYSDHQPFNRMLVRLKKEIIAFGVDGIDPCNEPSKKISPQRLKQWLDEGRPVTLLDTRNDYEVRLGTFENAVPIRLDHFRDFPAAVDKLPQEMADQPIVMFCTGGIRCEKAGPYMERAGFRDVYQLEGGILMYFEVCGGEYYEGDCFVFDKRTALDANLQETATTLCYACQAPLTLEEQQSEHYVPGESCGYCWNRDR
ncbi:MAG: sulfurtransferase [Planctomycetota bacterium]